MKASFICHFSSIAGVYWKRSGETRGIVRGDKKAALVALRRVRKREVRKMLVEKEGSSVKAKAKKAEVKTGRKQPKRGIGRRK
jgi:hypothetical protein